MVFEISYLGALRVTLTLHVTNNACRKQEQDGVVPKREINVAGVAKGHQKVMRIIRTFENDHNKISTIKRE